MAKNFPEVSIIVPTYNRASYLKECIESIINQTYKNFEIIIVDDGSKDNTHKIVKDFQQEFPFIKYIYQKNRGVSSARNQGILIAKGKYIAFCDSDDLWIKNKIETQIKLFKDNPHAMVCYTDEIWIRKGKRVNQCKHHKKFSGDIFEKSLELCIVSPSSVMMHRDFFKIVGLFDENLPACEDYDLWLRASIKFPFYFIEKPLIIKRGGHSDQLSKKYWGMDRFRIKSILKLLKNNELTSLQRMKALKVLRKKCEIIANGAKKRGYLKRANYYKSLIIT